MGHGLDHVAVGAQGAGAQLLSIAGGAHGADDELGVGLLKDLARLKQGAAYDLEWFALVRGVEGVDEVGVVIHQDELGGGGAAVDTQVGIGGRSRHGICVGTLRQAVAGPETLQLRLVGKEGLQLSEGVGATTLEGGERLDARGGVEGAGVVGEERGQRQRRSEGDDRLGMLGHDGLLVGEAQALLEDAHEHGVERARAALEDDRGLELTALRQAADGLLGDGMEARKCQVFLGHTAVEQGLDVGLGVYAAATGNVVDAGAALGERVEVAGLRVEKRGDLVDKGAGATCARAVHTHVRDAGLACFGVLLEEDDLGVLTAQLNGAAHLGVEFADGDGVGHDLLHEGQVELLGKHLAARAADGGASGHLG